VIIAFTGKLGSGKDTAADRLEAMLVQPPIDRRAFANLLKNSAAASLGVDRKILDDNKNNPEGKIYICVGYKPTDLKDALGEYLEEPNVVNEISFGEYYQLYGTQGHRDQPPPFGPDVWLDGCLPLDEDYTDKLVVVTDCRFLNEADRIHALGGYVVKVLGPDDLTSQTRQANHQSETEQDQIVPDFTIDNSIRDDDHHALDRQLVDILNDISAYR